MNVFPALFSQAWVTARGLIANGQLPGCLSNKTETRQHGKMVTVFFLTRVTKQPAELTNVLCAMLCLGL